MKNTLMNFVTAEAVMLPLSASAHFVKPEDAIKYRQAAFTVMGAHFGRVGAMVSGKMPWDAKAVADNIATAAAVHQLAFGVFVPGTDKGETKAKPEVWSKAPDFEKKRESMSAAMGKRADAVKGADQWAIKTAFGEVGKACKSCHDDYRNK